MLRRRYSNVPGRRPAHYAEPGSRPQEQVPFAQMTVRVCGEDQILMFEMMCALEGRRPHQLAADILLEAIRKAQADPRMAASCAAMAASRAAYQEARAGGLPEPHRRAALRVVREGDRR